MTSVLDIDKMSECKYAGLPKPFFFSSMACLGFPKDSKLLPLVNHYLGLMDTSGILDRKL